MFPSPESADDVGRVHVGGDLSPDTLLTAYRSGLFPLAEGEGSPVTWFSPDPRGILPIDGLVVSRSLRRSCSRYEVRVGTAFEAVIAACAASRDFDWLTATVRAAYIELHRLGWATSVEAWTPDGELAGGLYGVTIGGFFAGESMFSRGTDASKVALVGLMDGLREGGATLVDVQWVTPHLASLGAVAIPRAEFLDRLRAAVDLPPPAFLGTGAT